MEYCFFTANRPSAIKALSYLRKKNKVTLCVFEESASCELKTYCLENNITTTDYKGLVDLIHNGVYEKPDYAISFLFHKIMKSDVIDFFDGNIINFHPSLVQIHKGIGSFCYCLLNGFTEWGVTAHYLTKGVDEGDIILQRRFPVPPGCYGIELERIQQTELVNLFYRVIDMISTTGIQNTCKQDLSEGIYFGHKDLDTVKDVNLSDSYDIIDRKIRALWYPPYHGASILIDGKRYSLVNDELLSKIAELYKKQEDIHKV